MILKRIAILSLLWLVIHHTDAQTSAQIGAFDFLPQSVYANPALRPMARINVGVPVISQLHFNHENNFIVPRLYLENSPGKNTIINTAKIFQEMGDLAFLRQELDLDLIHVGIGIGKHYGYFGVRERLQFGVDLPPDLFKLFVYGNLDDVVYDNYTLNFSKLGINSMHFREYVFGYNMKFSDQWDFGVSAKYLYGMENINNTKTNITFRTDPETYDLYISGGGELRSSGLAEKDDKRVHDNMKKYLFGLKNNGVALNAGAVYKPMEKLQVEFSVHDLGFIKWKSHNANYGVNHGEFMFEGVDLSEFIFFKTEDFRDAFSQKGDSLIDAFKSVYGLYDSDEAYTTMLNGYFRVAGSYEVLPLENYSGKAWANMYHGITGGYYPFALHIGYTQNLKKIAQVGAHFSKVSKLPVAMGFGGVINAGPVQLHVLIENIKVLSFNRIKIMDEQGVKETSSFIFFRDPRQIHFSLGMNIVVGKKEKEAKEAKPLKR